MRASISEVALSFMVQEPSGIMLCVRERSLDWRRWMYRSNSVSEWYELKTGCWRNLVVRCREDGIPGSVSTSRSAAKSRYELVTRQQVEGTNLMFR